VLNADSSVRVQHNEMVEVLVVRGRRGHTPVRDLGSMPASGREPVLHRQVVNLTRPSSRSILVRLPR
jgi:hypothetical protein